MVNSQAPIAGENWWDYWGISYGIRNKYGDGIVYETGRNRVDPGEEMVKQGDKSVLPKKEKG